MRILFLTLVIVTSFLAGCGGGGSTSDADTCMVQNPPNCPPIEVESNSVVKVFTVSLDQAEVGYQESFQITYQFNTDKPLDQQYSVFVQFVDDMGSVQLSDNHLPPPPTPTDQWSGSIAYQRSFEFPMDQKLGTYSIVVALMFDGASLPIVPQTNVVDLGNNRYEVGSISLFELLIPDPSDDDPQPVVDVSDFGAIGDDDMDDTAAIQMAIDSTSSGTIYFPPGSYFHDDVIHVRNKQNFRLRGYLSELVSTEPTRQALFVEQSSDIELLGMTLSAPQAVTRLSTFEHMAITVITSSDVKIIDNSINGSSAAGIFISRDTNNYLIENNLVENTLADGIHNTGRSSNGFIVNNVTRNTGDDGIAIVSYANNNDYTRNISIVDNVVDGNTHGRGITVIGGKDIEIRGNTISATNAAGILVASEESFNTYAAKNIQIIDNILVDTNYSTVDHGGMFLYARSGSSTHVSGEVTLQHEDILIRGNTVADTVSGPAHFRLATQYVDRINIINNDFNDEDESKPPTNIGSNSDRYNFVNNRYNGVSITDHVGNSSIFP